MSEPNPMVEHVPMVTVTNSDGEELRYYVMLENMYGRNKLVPFLIHESLFNSVRLVTAFWRNMSENGSSQAVASFSDLVSSVGINFGEQDGLDVFPRILFPECKVADVMQDLYQPNALAHVTVSDDGDGNAFLSLTTDTEEIVEFTVDSRKDSVVTVEEATEMLKHRKAMYQQRCQEYVQENYPHSKHFPKYNA